MPGDGAWRAAATCAGMRGGDDGGEGGGRLVRAVMNKDVLCVELVVNHWQRWQLTDRQIDPRPPRERRLAPAHSSQPHERTWRAHKDCLKTRRRSRRVRSSSAVCGAWRKWQAADETSAAAPPLPLTCDTQDDAHVRIHGRSHSGHPDVFLRSRGRNGWTDRRMDGLQRGRQDDRMTKQS